MSTSVIKRVVVKRGADQPPIFLRNPPYNPMALGQFQASVRRGRYAQADLTLKRDGKR
jgi:hypothetical protein